MISLDKPTVDKEADFFDGDTRKEMINAIQGLSPDSHVVVLCLDLHEEKNNKMMSCGAPLLIHDMILSFAVKSHEIVRREFKNKVDETVKRKLAEQKVN